MRAESVSESRNARNHLLSVAPMVGITHRHFRYFTRLLTRHSFLYTEMMTTGSLLYGDRHKLLDYSPEEQPLAIQLAGSDADELATCSGFAREYGYREINLNVGCPSPKVQKGRFGACLMAEPETVAHLVEAMQRTSQLPVTVKHRTGIDDRDSYEELHRFVKTVAKAGVRLFIIHARKAILKGLNPHQNRTRPPLRYKMVYQIKKDFPELEIIINGGIRTLEDIQTHLQYVDGVMIGRAAYQNPYLLALAEGQIRGSDSRFPSRKEIISAYLPYIEKLIERGERPARLLQPLHGLFHGVKGSRQWRQLLNEALHQERRQVVNFLRSRIEQLPEDTEIPGGKGSIGDGRGGSPIVGKIDAG